MFCLRACCCLLLLCSRVPSPAVLSCPFSCCAVRAPSSSLPAELTRPFFFCTSSTDPTHYSTPSRSLWRTPHPYPPCFIDFSLCGLTGSFCRLPVQSLERTELIRHIFFNPISFISFFPSSVLHYWARLLTDTLLVVFSDWI